MPYYSMRYRPGLGNPGIFGDIWGEIKKLPGEISKIDVKDIEKVGEIVGAFKKGGKGGKGRVIPIQNQLPPPAPGISMGTLLLVVGGLGLGLYLLLRK